MPPTTRSPAPSSPAATPAASPVGGHDLPDPANDDLGRDALARAMQRVIRNTPPGWSTRLALTGEWGSGKTTVLQLLRQRLRAGERQEEPEDDDRSEAGEASDVPAGADEPGQVQAAIPLVLEVSVWGLQRESDLVVALFDRLQEGMAADGIKIDGRLKEAVRARGAWLSLFKKGAEATAGAIEKVALGSGSAPAYAAMAGWARSSAFEFAWGKLDGWLSVKKEEFTQHLLTLASHNKSVVVFIDDLDRADPRTIPQTLFALREILAWPNFTFVLAFDDAVVSRALRDYSSAYGERAEQFLEKVVDMAFPLTEPSAHGVERLAYRVMTECCPFIPDEVREATAQFFPPNPRLTKLIARSLGALKDAAHRHGPLELHWRAMVLQAILRACLPPDRVERIERGLLGADNRRTWRQSSSLAEVLGQVVSEEEGPVEEREAMVHRWIRAAPGRLTPDAAQQLFVELQSLRAEDAPAKIKYEMSLLVEEPSFTQREFEALLSAVTNPALTQAPHQVTNAVASEVTAAHGQDCRDFLQVHLAQARRRSRRSALEVAWDLVYKSIEAYEVRTRALAQASHLEARRAGVRAVEQVLTVLETLWAQPPMSDDIRRATGVQGHCESLLSNVALRGQEGELSSESGLCGRARQLASAIVERAEQPFRLYDWAFKQGSHAFREDWLVQPLHRRAVDEALTWFHDPDVLASALIRRGRATWFVDSAHSPLYSADYAGRLVKVFEQFAASPEPHVRDRGARLAHRLFLRQKEADEHMAGPRAFQPVWVAMWATVCSAPTTPSFWESIRLLHTWISEAPGGTAGQFPLPPWLGIPPADVAPPDPNPGPYDDADAGAGGPANTDPRST